MPPRKFEALIVRLQLDLGFTDVEPAPYSGDDSIDLRGSLGTHEQGLIIFTSDFSKGTRRQRRVPTQGPWA
jgi:hypothetical protein